MLGLNENSGFTITALEHNRYWVGVADTPDRHISVVQFLEPTASRGTRLLIRFRAYFAPTLPSWAFWLAFDVGDFLFMRKQMREIKRRAERAT